MKLSVMFEHAPDLEITGIASDSRQVQPGDMYFCMEGLRNDGHQFVDHWRMARNVSSIVRILILPNKEQPILR